MYKPSTADIALSNLKQNRIALKALRKGLEQTEIFTDHLYDGVYELGAQSSIKQGEDITAAVSEAQAHIQVALDEVKRAIATIQKLSRPAAQPEPTEEPSAQSDDPGPDGRASHLASTTVPLYALGSADGRNNR